MPLTPAEIRVVELLAEAHAAFTALPEHTPSDLAEWPIALHALQHRVMARAAVREHAGTFAPLSGTLPETPVGDEARVAVTSSAHDEPAADGSPPAGFPLGFVAGDMPAGWRAIAGDAAVIEVDGGIDDDLDETVIDGTRRHAGR